MGAEAGSPEDFEKALVSKLSGEDVDPKKQDNEDLADAKRFASKAMKHENRRVKQAHEQRKQIFDFALYTSFAVFFFSTLLVFLTISVPGWKLDNAVYVAYVSGNAIQFVGLLTVVAKYVFSDQATSKLFAMGRPNDE